MAWRRSHASRAGGVATTMASVSKGMKYPTARVSAQNCSHGLETWTTVFGQVFGPLVRAQHGKC